MSQDERAARAVAEQGGLATRRSLAAAGFDVRRLGDCPSLQRVARGVWATAPLPPWPRFVVTEEGAAADYVVRVRAALLALGPLAVARGRSAAALHAWGLLVEPRVVEASVPNGRRSRREPWIHVRQHRGDVLCQPLSEVLGDEVVVDDDLQVTTALQTAVDCLVSLPLLQAVVVVDSALRAKDVTVDELVTAIGRLRSPREAARARRALALCDPEAGSVLESVLRFRLVEAGITGFSTQVAISTSGGGRVLRVDVCFEAERLVVEADGRRYHPDPGVDRRTDNRLAAEGWRVLRLSWDDVVQDHRATVALVRKALRASSPAQPVLLAA